LGHPDLNQTDGKIDSQPKFDMLKRLQTESKKLIVGREEPPSPYVKSPFNFFKDDGPLDKCVVGLKECVQYFEALGVTTSEFSKLNLVSFMKDEIDKAILVKVVLNAHSQDGKWMNYMGFHWWISRHVCDAKTTIWMPKHLLDEYVNRDEDGVFIVKPSIYDSIKHVVQDEKDEKEQKEKEEKEQKETEKKKQKEEEKERKKKEEDTLKRTIKLVVRIPHSIKIGTNISLSLVDTTQHQFREYSFTLPRYQRNPSQTSREFRIPFVIDPDFNPSLTDPVYYKILLNKKPVLDDAKTFLFNGILYAMPFSKEFMSSCSYKLEFVGLNAEAPADYSGPVTKWPAFRFKDPDSKIIDLSLPTVEEWKALRYKRIKVAFMTNAVISAHKTQVMGSDTLKRPRETTELKKLEDEWNKVRSQDVTTESIDRLMSLQKKHKAQADKTIDLTTGDRASEAIDLTSYDQGTEMRIEDVD
jgi:hypothetical protein